MILGARQKEEHEPVTSARGYNKSRESSPSTPRGSGSPMSSTQTTPVDPVLAASFEDLIEKNDWEGLAKLAGREHGGRSTPGSSIGNSGHSADSAHKNRLPKFTNELLK